MKVAKSTVSVRGNITIPVAIQKALNLQKGDKIEWHIKQGNGQQVVIEKVSDVKG